MKAQAANPVTEIASLTSAEPSPLVEPALRDANGLIGALDVTAKEFAGFKRAANAYPNCRVVCMEHLVELEETIARARKLARAAAHPAIDV